MVAIPAWPRAGAFALSGNDFAVDHDSKAFAEGPCRNVGVFHLLKIRLRHGGQPQAFESLCSQPGKHQELLLSCVWRVESDSLATTMCTG